MIQLRAAPTLCTTAAMLHDNPNAFLGNPLNRVGIERRDPAWIRAQEDHPGAEMIVFAEGRPLIVRGDASSTLCWLTLDARSLLPTGTELILLGHDGEQPRFAVDVTGREEAFSDFGQFAPLRDAAPYLPPAEAAIAGQANWLLGWHQRHRFCARDGGETVMADGGLKRVNPATGAEHFPRTDPVAIVLPTHGDEVCLGRGPHFPPGFFSAFAGYVEPCETLEECAVREVKEEAGLDIVKLDYIFSQPWPFPSSLMVGFIGEVSGRELTLDPDEIEEARWFSKDEVRQVLSGEPGDFFTPPPIAIAHQLLKVWLDR